MVSSACQCHPPEAAARTDSCSSMILPASCSLASSSRSLADSACCCSSVSGVPPVTRCLRTLSACRFACILCSAAAGSAAASAAADCMAADGLPLLPPGSCVVPLSLLALLLLLLKPALQSLLLPAALHLAPE